MSFFDYYRIFFWVYTLCLFLRLVDVDDYRKQLKLSRVNTVLVFNFFVLVGFIICGIYQPAGPIGLAIVAYVFFAFIGLMVWYVYLPKIVSTDKVYEMDILSEEQEDNEYRVYGLIRESGFIFTVVMRLDEEQYKLFQAKNKKRIEVIVTSRGTKVGHATLEVRQNL